MKLFKHVNRMFKKITNDFRQGNDVSTSFLELPSLSLSCLRRQHNEMKVFRGVNKLSFLAECGGANQENRIVGGMPAGANRYPWMARIVYDGQFHCGASVLTKEYVLTAAHCVRK